MAETNQGLFFNPQKENVVGQAYNDLVVSQNERKAEEVSAATAATALQKAEQTAQSDAAKERLKILKEQASAAQKEAKERQKEILSAIKDIDSIPNGMYNAYGSSLREGAKYLQDNMADLIEQYGVEKVYVWTEQLNQAAEELSNSFNTSLKEANKLLADGELKQEVDKGFLESFSQSDYDNGMSYLNDTKRFKMNFNEGWQILNQEGKEIPFSEWVKSGITEPSQLFVSKPVKSYPGSVIQAWGEYPTIPKNLESEEAMEAWIEAELRTPNHPYALSAFDEYYNNQAPENMSREDFYSDFKAGVERKNDAISEFKDRWMELYRDAMKLKNKSKSSSSTKRSGEEVMSEISFTTFAGYETEKTLASMFIGEGPVSEQDIKSMGLIGVASLPSDITFNLDVLNNKEKEIFGVEGSEIKLKSLAFNRDGRLFIGGEGLILDGAESQYQYTDDILKSVALDKNEFKDPKNGPILKVLDFGSEPWIRIMKEVGRKSVTPTNRNIVRQYFSDLNEDAEEANFYIGLLSVAKSTNSSFLQKTIGEVAQANGISEDEVRKIVEQLNQ
jgi:molecular chaperone GrpE (heat shock protein)